MVWSAVPFLNRHLKAEALSMTRFLQNFQKAHTIGQIISVEGMSIHSGSVTAVTQRTNPVSFHENVGRRPTVHRRFCYLRLSPEPSFRKRSTLEVGPEKADRRLLEQPPSCSPHLLVIFGCFQALS